MRRLCLLLLFLVLPSLASAISPKPPLLPQEIVVDLRSPTYKDGLLTTKEGGVLTADDIRIQAREITYVHQVSDGKQISQVVAEGDLMLQYGDMVLVGKKIEYDFTRQQGVLYKGRSTAGKWYVGGEKILLRPDRSIAIVKAFVTTCENAESEWQLQAGDVNINKYHFLSANGVKVRFFKIPVFWLPNIHMNLKSVVDAPIKYKAAYRGREGSVLSMRYRFFSWKELLVYFRLDYVTGRGPGGGVESELVSKDNVSRFFTQNYAARDNSIDNPDKRFRYRFGGRYNDIWNHDRYTVSLVYDKLSDSEMPTDYHIDDFRLETARRTQLQIHREEESWIANLFTRVRLNSFQTINQELPTVAASLRPLTLGSSGIVVDNRTELSYLNYVFAKQTEAPCFHSSRLAFQQSLYRPFSVHQFHLLPQVDWLSVFYSNSPQDNAKLLGIAQFSLEANLPLSRLYQNKKHVIEPYVRNEFLLSPTVTIPHHYLFSIDDAYTRLYSTRFGARNTLYRKDWQNHIFRAFYLDLYAYAFYDARHIPKPIPRVYGDMIWTPLTRTYCSTQMVWNAEHDRLDNINVRLDHTFGIDAAFGVEYRFRDKYYWRKDDYTNFILDAFYSERVLLASPLSDRRNTFLTNFFVRLASTVAIEIQTRHGWHRTTMPAYNEGKVTLSTVLACRWHLKVYFERIEYDNRYGFNLSLGETGNPRTQPPITPVW